jgi:hypothetical protein
MIIKKDDLSPHADIKNLTKNLVWNTFLRHANEENSKYLAQLNSFLNDYFSSNPSALSEYTQDNIIPLINLQIPLNAQHFKRLPNQIKLKVFCLIFAKFVNKDAIITICKKFYHKLNLRRKKTTKKFIFT